MQIQAMRIFVRVAELASFTRAAQDLGLPKASASTAIRQLENRLGTRLLHRTTRRVGLTHDGRVFYERCRDLLSEIDDLQSLFQRGGESLRGRLRVDMPTGTARNHIIPRLPEFLAAHPDLEIELSSTDRRVDPVREGFDCVLRVGALQDSGLIARPLGKLRMVNCASPAYLRARGIPRELSDLARHRLIHYQTTFGAARDGFEYPHEGSYRSLPMAGAVTVNNAEAYESACLAGLGLIQVPVLGVRELLHTGRLIEILPQSVAEPMPMSIVYAARRNLPRHVQAFMSWLVETLGPYLAEAAAPAGTDRGANRD
ncbi:MAG: LysR family transcriptional regulator [Rudaea sp.]